MGIYQTDKVDVNIIESSQFLTVAVNGAFQATKKIILIDDTRLPLNNYPRCLYRDMQVVPLLLAEERIVSELQHYQLTKPDLIAPMTLDAETFTALRLGKPTKHKADTIYNVLKHHKIVNYEALFNLITSLTNPVNLHFINKVSPIQQMFVVDQMFSFILKKAYWFQDKATNNREKMAAYNKAVVTMHKLIVASISSVLFKHGDVPCPFSLLKNSINIPVLQRLMSAPSNYQEKSLNPSADIIFLEEAGLL
jgi:hypothetical protein